MIHASRKGLSLVELLLIVTIIGTLSAIALPNFLKMRENVQKNTCINNLRQIKLAKEQWALENNKEYTDTPVAANLDTYIKDGTQSLICPNDAAKSYATSYTINNVGTDPACKISLNHKI